MRTEHPPDARTLREMDWSQLTASDIPSRWQNLIDAEKATNFDSPATTLVRPVGIVLPGRRLHLLVTYPYFLLDEDAWFFLMCGLAEIFDGKALSVDKSRTVPLTRADMTWWNSQLAGCVPAQLRCHGDAQNLGTLVEHNALLTIDTTRQLNEACQKMETSTSDALRTIFAAVLARLTLQNDVLLLGSLESDNGGLVGVTGNVLPSRVTVDLAASFRDNIVREADMERARLQRTGVALSEIAWENNRAASPEDFTAFFHWRPPALNDRISEIYPQWLNIDAQIFEQEVHPFVLEVRAGHRIGLRLKTTKLTNKQAEAFFHVFQNAIEAFIEDPNAAIGKVPFAPPIELPARQSEPPVPPAPIHDVIAETIISCAGKPAVRGCDGSETTYRELDERANYLTRYLLGKNLTGGWGIGVCLKPGAWMPVAMLATLRAGNTCVPVEPSCPPGWILQRIEESDCDLVICDKETAKIFEGSKTNILVLDENWKTTLTAESPAERKPREEPPQYSLVLLGTNTAPPPLANKFEPTLLSTACSRSGRIYQIEQGDSLLVNAPAGTAAHAEQILCGLTAGATLVMADSDSVPLAATHLRVTADAFRAAVAECIFSKTLPPDTIKVVAVDCENSYVPAQTWTLWQRLAPNLTTVNFASPCGFVGMGLQFEGAATGLSVPAGRPTPSSGCTYGDLAGQPPPQGYAGILRFHPIHAKTTVEAWRAWYDKEHNFYLDSGCDTEIALCSVPGVLDAVTDPERKGIAWVVSVPDVTSEQLFAVVPHLQKIVFLDGIPQRLGRSDLQVLPVAADSNAAASPSAAAVKPVSAAAAEGGKQADAMTLPETFFQSLGGSSKAPLLIFVGPEDVQKFFRDHFAMRWSLSAITCNHVLDDPRSLAERLAQAMPEGKPLHFIAFGPGGILAYELVHQLRQAGQEVPYFLIVGASAPPVAQKAKSLFRRIFGLREDYHAQPLQGPCGIIATSDMTESDENRWHTLMPHAYTERSRRAIDQLTSTHAYELNRLLSKFADENDFRH